MTDTWQWLRLRCLDDDLPISDTVLAVLERFAAKSKEWRSSAAAQPGLQFLS